MYREETLLNVIRSVTRNGRSIILTAVLALILVYMFSIIGFMFFKDDFLVTVDENLACKYNIYHFIIILNAKNIDFLFILIIASYVTENVDTCNAVDNERCEATETVSRYIHEGIYLNTSFIYKNIICNYNFYIFTIMQFMKKTLYQK